MGSANGIVLLKAPSPGVKTWTLATSVRMSLEAGDAALGLLEFTSVAGLRSGVSDLIVDVRLVRLWWEDKRELSSHRSLFCE